MVAWFHAGESQALLLQGWGEVGWKREPRQECLSLEETPRGSGGGLQCQNVLMDSLWVVGVGLSDRCDHNSDIWGQKAEGGEPRLSVPSRPQKWFRVLDQDH